MQERREGSQLGSDCGCQFLIRPNEGRISRDKRKSFWEISTRQISPSSFCPFHPVPSLLATLCLFSVWMSLSVLLVHLFRLDSTYKAEDINWVTRRNPKRFVSSALREWWMVLVSAPQGGQQVWGKVSSLRKHVARVAWSLFKRSCLRDSPIYRSIP